MDHEINPSPFSKVDRKTVEKNRRNQMKALYCQLTSLVPHQSSKETAVCLSDQIEGAANYIKKLQSKLDLMKQKKNLLIMAKSPKFSSSFSRDSSVAGGLKNMPRVDINLNDSALNVVLITGLNHQFMFTETVRILHQEGADVVSASFSVVDHIVLHTIHSKIGGCRLEYEAARISERLRKFVIDDI